MVQPNVKPENSLKQPAACKANPCKKQVLGGKFAKFSRKHIKIFSLCGIGLFLFYVSFPSIHCFLFSPHPTNVQNFVPPFDIPALHPCNTSLAFWREVCSFCHLQAFRIIKCFYNLNCPLSFTSSWGSTGPAPSTFPHKSDFPGSWLI